jgi:hypothetical protein
MTGSGLRLGDMPGADAVTLELGAGQDGVRLWELANRDGGIAAREMFPGGSCITPAWRHDGKRLLTLDIDGRTYLCFSYPALERLPTQGQAGIGDGEPPALGYEMLWLTDDTAVVQSGDYRFWLFDPVGMQRLQEVVVNGWEPVPTCEAFPRLQDEIAPFSVIESWGRVGDLLLATTLGGWRNPALLVFTESELVAQLAARPHA